MADERSVVITIKLDENKDDLNPQNQTGSIGNASTSGSSSNSKEKAQKAAFKALALTVVAETASEVGAWAEYIWNRKLTLNDDYVGQRQKTIAMQRINTAISAASSIGSTAALGSAFGPIGAVIGAFIGLGISVAQVARSNIEGADQQRIMLRQMESQLEFTRARAGYSTKAASIGEDL